MKINRIQIDNFLGIKSVDATLDTPIALFCGRNGSGKSSIREAVRMAITGEAVRVNLKKEYDQLVADGAKAGGAMISVNEDQHYAFNVPDGKVSADEDLPTGASIAVALDGQRFASMSADEKRTFLFSVTGCRASTEEVRRRLVGHECGEAKIEAVLPMLRTGFPSAHEFAAEKATQAKRDWRAITGANYGGKAAEKWKAELPKRPDTLVGQHNYPAFIAGMDDDIARLNQQIGAAAAATRAASEAQAKREALKAKAESVGHIEENLELACSNLAQYLPQVEDLRRRASSTARVGLVHSLAYALDGMINLAQDMNDINTDAYQAAVAAMDEYEADHGELPEENSVDNDAKASLPEYENGLTVLQNAAKNLERDLEAAKAARATYDALEPANAAKSTAGDLDAMQAKINATKASRDKMHADLRVVEQYEATAAAAAKKTKDAAACHLEVLAWLQIADALAPDGIPGELLAEALKPINSTLQIAASDTKWPRVCITADMQITADGRPYTLLSESEQWRVDAMIAQSIAKISGHKILMLDRMDVLDLPGRGQLLGWLDMLAEDGQIETALLFATLKGLPTGLPATISANWIEAGTLTGYGEVRKVAA